ncbi:hypothetical protein [Ramlibacter albus]|uniref:Uncharacterized protein n=1 Tax=Ramlibacter albus TaxID=2079448 RepID=A0A923M8I6_9BURK|nr:hypothetical protein [Ramlibacter albus]MBC5765661.1 hypothetical protein [Ramlibacter albus]
MDPDLNLLRSELHLLMEQEAAALIRATEMRRRGDLAGAERAFAESLQIKERRGSIQKQIKRIVGPPIDP